MSGETKGEGRSVRRQTQTSLRLGKLQYDFAKIEEGLSHGRKGRIAKEGTKSAKSGGGGSAAWDSD